MPAKPLSNRHILGWMQAAPLTFVLLAFLIAPIVMIVVPLIHSSLSPVFVDVVNLMDTR